MFPRLRFGLLWDAKAALSNCGPFEFYRLVEQATGNALCKIYLRVAYENHEVVKERTLITLAVAVVIGVVTFVVLFLPVFKIAIAIFGVALIGIGAWTLHTGRTSYRDAEAGTETEIRGFWAVISGLFGVLSGVVLVLIAVGALKFE